MAYNHQDLLPVSWSIQPYIYCKFFLQHVSVKWKKISPSKLKYENLFELSKQLSVFIQMQSTNFVLNLLSIPPENTWTFLVFCCFQGLQKLNKSLKWINEAAQFPPTQVPQVNHSPSYFQAIHLPPPQTKKTSKTHPRSITNTLDTTTP